MTFMNYALSLDVDKTVISSYENIWTGLCIWSSLYTYIVTAAVACTDSVNF